MAASDDKWSHVSKMLTRAGPLANQGNFGTLFEPAVAFEPTPDILMFLQQMCRMLSATVIYLMLTCVCDTKQPHAKKGNIGDLAP